MTPHSKTLSAIRATASVLLSVCLLQPSMAQTVGEPPTPPRSLDERLLDDLGPSLLEGLDPPTTSPAEVDRAEGDDASAAPQADAAEIRRRLIDSLLEGDDLGMDDNVDPFTRIGLRMQAAGERLAGEDASEATQRLQARILEELAAMIDRVQRSKRSAPQGAQQERPALGEQPADPDAGEPGAQGQDPTQSAPQQSIERMGDAEEVAAESARIQSLIEAAWGHLPQRLRQQLPAASGERFLPKYEKMIEDYFRRLAEDSALRP